MPVVGEVKRVGRPKGSTGPTFISFKNMPEATQAAIKAEFLEALELCGSVQRAAAQCGFSYTTFERIKAVDPEFAAAWNECWRVRINQLEDTLLDRAQNGWEEPVYQMGTQVGTKTVHDNRLGVFFLQKQRPEQYGDKIEITMEPAKVANAVRAHLEDADAAAEVALKQLAAPQVVAESTAKSTAKSTPVKGKSASRKP